MIEKNVTLPIDQIVRKRRKDRGEAFTVEGGLDEPLLDPLLYSDEAERMKLYKSYYGEFSST